MSRKQRIRIKLIVILSGVILLAFIMAVNITKIQKTGQKQGEYIPLYRVLLLLETIEPSLKEAEDFQIMEKESQNLKTPENITYGQYRVICSLTEKEGVSYPVFEKEYEEDCFVTKEDFEKMFEIFLRAYDSEGKLQIKEVTILGSAENIVPEGKTKLQAGEVLTTEGTALLKDLQIKNLRFQTAEMYCYGDQLITVRAVIKEQYELNNVWVMESDDNEGIRLFYDGMEIFLHSKEIKENVQEKVEREQIADLAFQKGVLEEAESKTNKLNGKILSRKENSIVLEEKGEFEIAENFKAYRLYGTLEQLEKKDLIIGYDFTDFVLENGKICAALVLQEEKMETIRVLIKNSDFTDIFHERVQISCDTDFTITYRREKEERTESFQAGEIVTIEKSSDYLKEKRVVVKPAVLSGKIKLLHLERSQGVPEYRGSIELTLEEDNIYIINEVLLEEYLYSVVPSEMPATYPAEALKAQAVCARTYAYAKLLHSPLAWYGAHVDDSTSYQVYNNIAEKAETTKAVKETAGMLLACGNELVGAYYYSTSCGFGTTAAVWKNANADISYLQAKNIGSETGSYTAESLVKEENFEQFIQTTESSDFEKEEGWYRWCYEAKNVNFEKMEERLKTRYDVDGQLVLTLNKQGEYESKRVENIGKIKDIIIEKRNPGGVADELVVTAENAKIKVIGEYNIRYVLNDGETKVKRQDGKETASAKLLPSAFFVIHTEKENGIVSEYTIIGGGYGHGVGMSQNGAKAMAEKGWNYESILNFFFNGSSLKQV